ncbi:hypothetical protein V8B55DRAFT_1436142 [Mucor lusitanicus]
MQTSFSTLLFIFAAAAACLLTTQAAPVVSNLQARGSRSGGATYYAVALSTSLMGGHNSDLCGKYINVKSGSASVTVKVVDSCPALF